MADINCMPNNSNANNFKEAVCINAGRIYDSCSDKDCLEDLRVLFTEPNQQVINRALSIKCKKVEVLNVFMDVEPVAFNRGFYSVDMTFYFKVVFETCVSPLAKSEYCEGLAVFSKKVILYGSEGNVRTFCSKQTNGSSETKLCGSNENVPSACIQVVDPICLSCKICECNHHCCEINCSIPSFIASHFEGDFLQCLPEKTVVVSLGLFSIVQLEREVQMMVPVYDFCIPDKECIATNDDPCELFKRIKFPVNEFFPPKLSDVECEEVHTTNNC